MNTTCRTVARAALLLTHCFTLTACAGSSDRLAESAGVGNADPAAGGAASAADASDAASASGAASGGQLVGAFQLKLSAASGAGDATTNLVGKVYDGPVPASTLWENPRVDGACTLTTPRIPFCNTACEGSRVCSDDDTCTAYPSARSVGTVSVSGVKTSASQSSFTMTPIANNYQPSEALAYPPFAEGDALTVSAAGDFFPAFSLKSRGIAPLELSSTQLELESGKALELTWTKAALGNSTIHVKLDISHHGGSKGQIECETNDGGSLVISGSLIGQLLDLGVAGYPTIIVTRQAIGATTVSAGRVELIVSSVVEQAVSIDGLASCTADGDCPSGQTCQTDLTCK